MSSAFKMLGNNDHEETAKFCAKFDRFFDCLNTRAAGEGKKKRKPDLDPYRSVDDKRFKVSFKVTIKLIFILNCFITSGWKRTS